VTVKKWLMQVLKVSQPSAEGVNAIESWTGWQRLIKHLFSKFAIQCGNCKCMLVGSQYGFTAKLFKGNQQRWIQSTKCSWFLVIKIIYIVQFSSAFDVVR